MALKAAGQGQGGRHLSAGVVVVRDEEGGWRYLLLRAYRYWDFPKGGVEPGETPAAAARREVAEETGISRLWFLCGEAYTETPPYGRGKVARYYLAATDEDRVVLPVSPELGRPEHHEYRWLDYAAARDLLVPRVRNVLAWARGLLEGAGPAGGE